MSFITIEFLLFVLAILLAYFLVPKQYRWIVLLIGNIVFYLFAGWRYSFYLLFTSLSVWGGALLISRFKKKAEDLIDKEKSKTLGWAKLTVAIVIILNIGILFVLKYLEWTTGIVNSLFHTSLPMIHLIVPLGISFYTFSSLGYLIDIYREMYEPEKNYFKLFTAISFFPTVLQGPICSFDSLLPQVIEGHDFDKEEAWWGFKRMVLGFFKKIIIADLIAVPTSYIFSNYSSLSGGICLLGAVFYAIQLYADFSGYMDIAIGLARILGIKLPENFDMPYISHSVAEYWRRWHITLGAWFRNYLYYPLMRSRFFTWLNKKIAKKNRQWANRIVTSLVLIITWILTGVWHGASYTYIFYGCYYALILALDVLLTPLYKWLKKKLHINDKSLPWQIFQVIRTFAVVSFCYIFFNGSGFSSAANMALKYLRFWEWGSISTLSSWGIDWWAYFIIIAAIAFVWLMNSLYRDNLSIYVPSFELSRRIPKVGQGAIIALTIMAIVAVFIYQLSLGDFTSSFIYFEF